MEYYDDEDSDGVGVRLFMIGLALLFLLCYMANSFKRIPMYMLDRVSSIGYNKGNKKKKEGK